MKKLVFMFVAMAAISFASCGGEKAGNNADSAAADSANTENVAATDSNVQDSTNTEAAAPAATDSVVAE